MSIGCGAGAPIRLILLCAAISALASACGQPEVEPAAPAALLDPAVPVQVTGGEIRGAAAAGNPDLVAFQGVPYAAPPVGDLRWKPPQPVVAWDGVRDAAAPGPICMQTGPVWVRAPTATEDDPESEDCLFLNIWAPKTAQEPLPVMVWIHGGGFFSGAGSLPIYDGTRIAENGVVLVSINYRLSVFGFFAHPALSAESPHGASGNYGLMDMVAALEWVRDNIAAFGGDPNRVTIFGESAGAGAVMALLLVPQSEGLFHRAISGSTWVYGWDRELREPSSDWVSAEAQGAQIAEWLGASGDAALDTLRASTSERVQEAANADTGNLLMRTGYIWAPNVDGWIIPSDPLAMYEAGLQHDVPLITGTTSNEGASSALRANIEDRESFELHVRTVYPGFADEMIAHFGVTSPETARPGIAHLMHDMRFAGPVRVQVETHAQVSSPVWLYQFTRVPPTALGAAVDAPYHGAELPYVFGTMVAGPAPAGARPSPMTMRGDWTETDRRVSDTMIDYWTQFAATGNPNRDGLPEWPEFDKSTDRHLNLGETVTSGERLHQPAGELFRRFEASRRAGT
ncbi:MAG: carboxylesterase family protein [Acidobacteria bacterium]|nr:carboxylesterase family protein [Acidobacteriota bacterium]